MSQERTGFREWAAIAGILLLAAGLRGAILFGGHRGLRSDEAVVGLMAKHIVTRGETPIFLYGQPYGGGHAIVAYLAAPLFALFGRSATLLTGISLALSLVNIWLVWLIVRRLLGGTAAAVAAALYAFSPPLVYQSYLVNGGTEAFLLALLALHFFLRSYMSEEPEPLSLFLAGLFAGLAYWAMDYTLLYPVVFVLLWLACGRWRGLARFACGFLVGCLPLLAYDVTNDFEHLRYMFAPAAVASVGFLQHFFGALWGVASKDLAAFFGGDIDDFHPGGAAAWIHAAVAALAVAIVLWRNRAAIAQLLKSRPFAANGAPPLPASLLPAVFIFVYLGMYAVAKFSLPGLRTPRYLLPLCPFLFIAIADAVAGWRGKARIAGLAVVVVLVVSGAAASLRIGLRSWHEEHRIVTHGSEMDKLAAAVEERGIRFAFAPYEIQWRLMFATDERVLVSSVGISPGPAPGHLSRYPYYDEAVEKAVGDGEDVAFIFREVETRVTDGKEAGEVRKHFAFAEWAANRNMGLITREIWMDNLERAGLSPEQIPVGEEFVIFYPVKATFTQSFLHAVKAAMKPGAGREGPAPGSGD